MRLQKSLDVRQLFYRYDPGKRPYRRAAFCAQCGAAAVTVNDGGWTRSKCPACGYSEYRNPSPAVSMLIVHEGCVLLGKRAAGSFGAGKWCLPCGFVEYSEDFLTAAIRETLEETGLIISLKSIINVTANFLSPDLHSIVVVFLASIAGGKAAAGDDLTELKWVPLGGAYPALAFEADIEIIRRFSATHIRGLPIDEEFSKRRSDSIKIKQKEMS